MYDYHLAHAITFLMFRNKYHASAGSGISYITELYHDFGCIGIIFGNFIYGFILVYLV